MEITGKQDIPNLLYFCCGVGNLFLLGGSGWQSWQETAVRGEHLTGIRRGLQKLQVGHVALLVDRVVGVVGVMIEGII